MLLIPAGVSTDEGRAKDRYYIETRSAWMRQTAARRPPFVAESIRYFATVGEDGTAMASQKSLLVCGVADACTLM